MRANDAETGHPPFSGEAPEPSANGSGTVPVQSSVQPPRPPWPSMLPLEPRDCHRHTQWVIGIDIVRCKRCSSELLQPRLQLVKLDIVRWLEARVAVYDAERVTAT